LGELEAGDIIDASVKETDEWRWTVQNLNVSNHLPGLDCNGEHAQERGHGSNQCDENWQSCCVLGLSQRMHGPSFLFPRYVDSAIRGSGRGEEPRGANVLGLIRIR
jgi:hypothetical protein